MTTFLDSSILISILKSTELNHVWAVEAFNKRVKEGPVLINDVVYSEVSVSFESVDDINRALSEIGVERYSGGDTCLFSAGRAFKKYKSKNKGPKLGVLPDFFIGATASEAGAPLLTNNAADFVTYFPNLILIVPPEIKSTQCATPK